MLGSFASEFELLYGEKNMVYNVHQLRHLAGCVKMNGPVFAYSNYCMEDNIGHLVSHVKGTTDVLSQISSNYMLEKNLFFHLQKTSIAKKFYENIESKLSFSTVRKINDSLVIGKEKPISNLTSSELSLIRNCLKLSKNDEISEYKAAFLHTKIFYETLANSIGKRSNDSFILNAQSKRFADIKTIFIAGNQLYFFIVEKYELRNDSACKSINFLEMSENQNAKIITPELIGPKYVFIVFSNIISCSKFPNLFERN